MEATESPEDSADYPHEDDHNEGTPHHWNGH